MSESRSSHTTDPQYDGRFDVAIVDQSEDAMDAARDAAEERLTDELNADGNKLQRFARAVWKGNIAKEYYRQQYILEAHKKIVDSNDVYAHTGAQDVHKTEALTATIDRFTQGNAETIHEEAGESHEVLAEDDELSVVTKDLVRKYASGAIDEAALREEQARVIGAYRSAHGGEEAKRGMVQIDNILQVARAVKGAVEHGESLDAVTREMNVSIGSARNSVRTSHTKTWTDKAIEKVGKSKIGRLSFVTPDMIVAGTSIAASVARVGSTSLLGAIGKTLVPGAAAGVIAGAREARQVRKERVQHMREMAQGSEFDDSSKRRKEMEENRYDTRSAKDETERLQAFVDFEDFQNGDPAAIKDTLHVVSELQSRIRQSDADGIDRLTYSSVVSVGQERFDLDLTLAKAKVALREKLANVDAAELSRELGIDATLPIDQLVEQTQQLYEDEGRQDVTAKDEVFKKLRRKRVLSQAAIGAGTGMLIGAGVQEAMAAVSPSRVGLIDNITQQDTKLHEGRAHTTIFERMREALPFDDNQLPDYGPGISERPDGHGQFRVAGGTAIVEGDQMKLVSADGNLTVEAIPMNGDGSVSDDVRQRLEAQGLVVETEQVSTEQVITETRPTNAQGYVAHHLDKTALVTRDIWYDNNTTVFDLNELGLWAGGENGSGINPDGSFSYSVAAMAEGGSFTGDQSIAWQSAVESGTLKFAISATEGTQTQPFMLGVNPDGSINVPSDHPAAKLFSVENGQLQFNGAYGEVVQTTGVDANGVEHVRPLATMVGNNTFEGAPIEVTEKTSQNSYVTTITMPEPERFTEMAPVIPVTGRRSMERARKESSYRYYDNYRMSNAERQRFRREISPRLRDNPDASLVPSQEIAWFADNLRSNRGDDYVDSIVNQISTSPSFEDITDSKDVIVTMPVAAANEADNIYRTLSLYAQQEGDAAKSTLLLLNVNWTDTAVARGSQAEIDKTRAEIARAQNDFPELTIMTVENEYKQADIDRTGGVVGYVADDLTNAALLAINERMSTGAIDPNHEIALLRHDADMQGMSARLLKRFRDESRTGMPSGIDVFKGTTRFDVRKHVPYPGFGVVSNFSAALSVASASEGRIHTGGANFAVRAATLAAVGGLGNIRDRDTGPGSDDLAIGRRIADGRDSYGYAASSRSGYRDYGESSGADKKRVRFVAGASIDTDAQRLIPPYILGRSFQDAWSPSAYNGLDGYSPRDAEAKILAENPADDFSIAKTFRAIEENISSELHYNSADASKKALSVFFGAVPGAYRIEGQLGSPSARIRLTKAGKKYLKSRIAMDTRSATSAYGSGAMRRLYERRQADGRAQFVSSIS